MFHGVGLKVFIVIFLIGVRIRQQEQLFDQLFEALRLVPIEEAASAAPIALAFLVRGLRSLLVTSLQERLGGLRSRLWLTGVVEQRLEKAVCHLNFILY